MNDRAAPAVTDAALLGAVRQLRARIEVDAAWGTVDRHLRPRLLAYFQGHGLARADAEDLVQTTLARVYAGVSGLRDETRFLPWLFVIARNERRRWWEASSRQPPPAGDGAADAAARLPDPRPDAAPESMGQAAERARAVGSAIDALPAQQRQCLLLRAVDELSYEEIAATLRLSVHTVRNHLAQARQGLRRRLGEEFGRKEVW